MKLWMWPEFYCLASTFRWLSIIIGYKNIIDKKIKAIAQTIALMINNLWKIN